MTELRSGPNCRGNERFVDQYGDGDTGRYADHYGGSRGKNDTCGCGESARERDERRACGSGDTSKYADHYGGGLRRNDTCGCAGGEEAKRRTETSVCGCSAADEAVTRHAETLIDDNGVAYTEKVVKSSCCGHEGKKKLR